jgi:hypothetical protein
MSQNRLYFRTVEDTNKTVDKNDVVHYNYVDLSNGEQESIQFQNPYKIKSA